MSVYNHRAMIPNPQNRIVEMLEAIRAEFDQLAQEAYLCKSQRDDFEHKMSAQEQEMVSFQQSLHELERSQLRLKEHYEDEISRLRQQLDHAQARGGGGGVGPPTQTAQIPVPYRSQPPVPSSTAPPGGGHHSGGPAPPNLGTGSNYFSGIMNSQHHLGLSTSQPNLATPPPVGEQTSQYPGYPAHASQAGTAQQQQQHQQQQGHLPPNGGPPPALKYMNSSPHIPPLPSSGPQQTSNMYDGRMPTSPAPGPYSRQDHGGYGYGSRGIELGQPTTYPSVPEIVDKRKPGLTPGRPAPVGAVVKPGSAPGGGSNILPGALADVDPESVPADLKVEGKEWFALFNPKVPRCLIVNLAHTLDHASVVCCVKFSADGKYLAAGCNRITVIYDVATSRRICALQDESVQLDGDLYIRSVCFSPNGNYLATGAEDKQIRIWDIATGRIRNRLTGHEQDIYSLDFSRDGRVVVSGSGDRTVRIWNMADGTCLHTLTITDQDQKDPGVTSVAVSPDGRRVAAGSLDKMVRVWDIQTGEALERLEGHKDSVYSVAFMPDGRTLVSGSLDKTLKLWQLGTNEGRGYGVERDRARGPCKMTFTGHKDFVLSVACTPDGRWIVSGSKDRSVQFWDPQTGQTQFMLQGHKNSVISVAISQSGRPFFATGSGDNRARIWSYEPII